MIEKKTSTKILLKGKVPCIKMASYYFVLHSDRYAAINILASV